MLKKLVPNFFDKKKHVLHYEILQFLRLKNGIKAKKNAFCIRIQSITIAKTACQVEHTKKNR